MRPVNLPARGWANLALVLIGVCAGLAVFVSDRGSAGADPSPQFTSCDSPRTIGSSHTAGAGGLMLTTNLDQMTDESDLVLVGTVKSFQSCRSHGPVEAVTRVAIAPEATLKGRTPGSEVKVTVEGGRVGRYWLLSGLSPEFSAGERVVLFLKDDGSRGMMPAAVFQSKLTVQTDGTVERADVGLSR